MWLTWMWAVVVRYDKNHVMYVPYANNAKSRTIALDCAEYGFFFSRWGFHGRCVCAHGLVGRVCEGGAGLPGVDICCCTRGQFDW